MANSICLEAHRAIGMLRRLINKVQSISIKYPEMYESISLLDNIKGQLFAISKGCADDGSNDEWVTELINVYYNVICKEHGVSKSLFLIQKRRKSKINDLRGILFLLLVHHGKQGVYVQIRKQISYIFEMTNTTISRILKITESKIKENEDFSINSIKKFLGSEEYAIVKKNIIYPEITTSRNYIKNKLKLLCTS